MAKPRGPNLSNFSFYRSRKKCKDDEDSDGPPIEYLITIGRCLTESDSDANTSMEMFVSVIRWESISSTYLGELVGNTFRFPLCLCLWTVTERS